MYGLFVISVVVLILWWFVRQFNDEHRLRWEARRDAAAPFVRHVWWDIVAIRDMIRPQKR